MFHFKKYHVSSFHYLLGQTYCLTETFQQGIAQSLVESILRHPDDYPFAGRLVCVGVPQVLVYPCLINSSFLLTEKANDTKLKDLGSNSYLIFFFHVLKMNLFIIIREANYFKILWVICHTLK